MTAKEMFEELGFEVYEDTGMFLTYRKYLLEKDDENFDENDAFEEVFFNNKDRLYLAFEVNDHKDNLLIYMPLNKAIQKQIEESWW